MTKRFICMILCLIMILGVLPIAAGAAEISEVSILGVRQPIAGETFDTSYSIPSGVGYAKDSAYAEIEWYDQGTSFSAAKTYGTPSGTKLSSGAKAVSGHCYVAVLHLARKDNNTFPKKSFSVSVSDEMAMRVQGKDGWSKDISSSSYYGAVYLYYKTDVVYDDNNGIYLTLNRPFDGTVVAGERVWSASDFSFDGVRILISRYSGKSTEKRSPKQTYSTIQAVLTRCGSISNPRAISASVISRTVLSLC